MKVAIDGFIVAHQYEWEPEPSFTWLAFDPTAFGKDYAVVKPYTIVTDVPDDFGSRLSRVSMLQARKAEIQAKMASEIMSIDAQIKHLLASSDGGAQ